MSIIPPRVLRHVSDLTGGPAFGLVLEDEQGIPSEVCNLTAHDPSIGGSFETFNTWTEDGTHRGFALAARVAADPAQQSVHCERIEPGQVLPPVDVSEANLRAGRRFIISMGLNYRSHRAETNRGSDLIMVNATETTGPYDDLRLTPEALLPDIEAEVGCVLLADVDLHAVPPLSDLEGKLAHFVVNDLNDRAPMILDEKMGYTAGKSDPGYVPIGPWMVHGARMPVFSEALGLEICCTVAPKGAGPQPRQRDWTTGVIRDPASILQLLAEQLAADPDKAHPNRRGERFAFAQRRGNTHVLPAGSLVLTGTPGGTALRAPGALQRIGLLIRGGLSVKRARGVYVRDLVKSSAQHGYLQPGDVVETAVERLGMQRWRVLRG